MLARDSACRLETATQARYARCGDCIEGKCRVTASVQRKVVAEFGFTGRSNRVGVDLLQSALTLYPGDACLVESAFYLKHNICVPCPLAVGAIVPNVMLSEISPAVSADPTAHPALMPLPLHTLCAGAKVTVLCCGSGT